MLDILYEDNHLIVCYKPKGILSQADNTNKKDMLTLIKGYIKEKYHKQGEVFLGLVHRLDINTSGIMVFARTSKAAARLSLQIKEHTFEKRYLATVEGTLDTYGSYIMVKDYLIKDEEKKKSYVTSSENGKEAVLEYCSLNTYLINNTTVTDLEICLHTGRFHQIRCQLANLGHPLYGDAKYGSKNKISELEFPLTAYMLSFDHPITKERLVFKYTKKR